MTSDPRITSVIDSEELAELFNPEYYLRNIDRIYNRFKEVGGCEE